MMTCGLLVAVAWLCLTATALGQGSEATAGKSKVVKATYLISGLNCPPCSQTLEASLRRAKGIRAVKVDSKTRAARIEFDESVLPAQRVGQLIADTPHMMGRRLQYTGWLLLKVPALRDESSGQQVKQAVSKVEGIASVVVYPASRSIGVQFSSKGELTSRELIDKLSEAEIDSSLFF